MISGKAFSLGGFQQLGNLFHSIVSRGCRKHTGPMPRDGFFVRVPAGEEFYLYVTETIDQATGERQCTKRGHLGK